MSLSQSDPFLASTPPPSASPSQSDGAITSGRSQANPAGVSGQAADLVANGSFETPKTGNSGVVNVNAGTNLGGWVVALGQIDLVAQWQAAEGSQSVDLNGTYNQVQGAVYQDLVTTPDQTYYVTWAMAGNPDGAPAVKQLEVMWAGTVITTPTFDATGKTRSNMGWVTHSAIVTATSTVTRLHFRTLTTGYYGPALDNIHVTPAIPIVLLPGIMGSKLANQPDSDPVCALRPSGEVWPNLPLLARGVLDPLALYAYNIGLSSLVLDDTGTASRNACDQIRATTIVTDGRDLLVSSIDFYGSIVRALESDGYLVRTFPYDWRQDLNTSVIGLDEFIEANKWSKVILLGHSMGGLLARAYVANAARADKVLGVNSVGTPYWGAPMLAVRMREGSNPFFPGMNIVPDPQIVRQVIEHSPGSLQLLPSDAYMQQVRFTGGATSGPGYFTGTGQAQPYSTVTETLNYFSGNDGAFSARLLAAAAFHGSLDLMTAANAVPASVSYFALRSTNQPTVAHAREYHCPWSRTWLCLSPTRFTEGDGTVPYQSAGWGASADFSGAARVCTYGYLSDRAEHGSLLSDPVVISDVKAILALVEGRTTLLQTACSQEANASAGAAEQATAFAGLAAGDSLWALEVWGYSAGWVENSTGQRLGTDSTGTYTNTLPGALFAPQSDVARFYLPSGMAYTLTLTSATERPVQVKVSDFAAPTADSGLEIQKVATFLDVSLPVQGTASISMGPSLALSALRIVSRDGGGLVVASQSPNSVVDQLGLADVTPPVTHISVQGAHNSLGFYSGPVTVTLEASDVGTGVTQTYYSLDAGNAWLPYLGPVSLTAENVPLFLASSLDGNTNAEYPPAALRLVPYPLFVPLLMRQGKVRRRKVDQCSWHRHEDPARGRFQPKAGTVGRPHNCRQTFGSGAYAVLAESVART